MSRRQIHRRIERMSQMVVLAGVVVAVLFCLTAMFFRGGKRTMLMQYGEKVAGKINYLSVVLQTPILYTTTEQKDSLIGVIESKLLATYPLYAYELEEEVYMAYAESPILEEMLLADVGIQEVPETVVEEEIVAKQENTSWQGDLSGDEEKAYPINSIGNYQTALDTFYHVDSTTMLGEDLLDVTEFLSKDMTIDKNGDGPKILIYHTHSQEGYNGSDKTVVDVGNVLTDLLENTYGIKVLHHTGEYDVDSRDHAYSNALPEITQILKDNPSIEVIIDLHRDGVNENTHLVTTIDGKQVAKIMFFNGVSQTKKNGKLDYLYNPNLNDNLAFSFQMQLAAKTYYPSLTRDIYIKGYCYNMHLLPKTLLVEVGAQTNTYEEACNSMEYLAQLLYRVLTVKR